MRDQGFQSVLAIGIPILVSIGVFVLVFGLVYWMNKKMIQHFKLLGKKLGLKYSAQKFIGLDKSPQLLGTHKGRELRVASYTRGYGRNKTVYTYSQLPLEKPAAHTLNISRESVIGKVFKALGGQDIQVGNSAFDDMFVIKSTDEDFAKKILSAKVQNSLLQNFNRLPGRVELRGGDVRYIQVGMMSNEKSRENIETSISVLYALVEQAEGGSRF